MLWYLLLGMYCCQSLPAIRASSKSGCIICMSLHWSSSFGRRVERRVNGTLPQLPFLIAPQLLPPSHHTTQTCSYCHPGFSHMATVEPPTSTRSSIVRSVSQNYILEHCSSSSLASLATHSPALWHYFPTPGRASRFRRAHARVCQQ